MSSSVIAPEKNLLFFLLLKKRVHPNESKRPFFLLKAKMRAANLRLMRAQQGVKVSPENFWSSKRAYRGSISTKISPTNLRLKKAH